jgi:ribosomal-protein-alanine N-acetyltransferase
MTEQLPYLVEPMTLADLDQVMEIEQVTFSTPWSVRAYRYEIAENKHSTIVALRPTAVANGPFKRLARHTLARRLRLATPGPVLGYAGYWFLVDEAHIYTIAVDPQWRGRGLGELLLLTLMERGMEAGADRATLEVRVSNQIAQRLYSKYGFEIVSQRKGYYSDNNEDAYVMTTPSFATPEFQASLARWHGRLYARLQAQDADIQTVGRVEPQTASWLDKKPHLR